MKRCSSCKVEKDRAEFHVETQRKDGLYPSCKACRKMAKAASMAKDPRRKIRHRAQISDWRQKNKSRVLEQDRARRLVKKYGLTKADVAAMAHKQGHCCAICGSMPIKLHIDHCHATGRVRALLCSSCNMGLGHLVDSPERLRAAALFVEKYV